MSTLAAERVAIGTGQEEAVQRLLAAGVPDYAERTGLHVATAMSVALLGERGAHPAIRKLIGTGHRQAVAETVLELLGPDGAADSEASYEFLLTRCLSIAGGAPPSRKALATLMTGALPGPPCPRAGGWTRARKWARKWARKKWARKWARKWALPRPPTSTWLGTGARSRHPGPFGYVITCTGGWGWTCPTPCTGFPPWSPTWSGSSAARSTGWSGRHVHRPDPGPARAARPAAGSARPTSTA
jgi:hypothetical protein